MILSRSEMEAWGALAKRALRLLRPAPKVSPCCSAPIEKRNDYDAFGGYYERWCSDCGGPACRPSPAPGCGEPGTPIRVPPVRYERGGVFPSAARYFDPYTKQYLVGDVIVNAETLLGGMR